jgi:hypothetical protein
MDEAGSADIYAIDLLEAMMMADEAWDAVDQLTIKNCWEHTEIQPLQTTNAHSSTTATRIPVLADKNAWDILHEYAVSDDITMPQAEAMMKAYLGSRYTFSEWKRAFDVILSAENDPQKALEGLEQLAQEVSIKISATH